MNTKLQGVEIERAVLRYYHFAVEHAASWQLLQNGIDQFGEVAVEWLFVTTLDHHFFAVTKDQCAKAVPLRFENPFAGSGQLVHTFGEHRQNRRGYGDLHLLQITPATKRHKKHKMLYALKSVMCLVCLFVAG